MNFWNYIGEFFLFRWAFGKIQQKEEHESVTKSTNQKSLMSDCVNDNDAPADRSSSYYHGHLSRNSYGRDDYGWNNQSLNDFHEEQDDYDMMNDF